MSRCLRGQASTLFFFFSTGRDLARRSGHKVSKNPGRVGLGHEVFEISRDGSSQVRGFANVAGRVESGEEEVESSRVRGFSSIMGRVEPGQGDFKYNITGRAG